MTFLKQYLLSILILCQLSSFSQQLDSNEVDKKVQYFPKIYGVKRFKPLVALDARRSRFASTKIKINGLRLGLTYKGVHRFGFGFYGLNKNISFYNFSIYKADQNIEQPEVRFNLGYTSIFYERVFIKTKRWEIALPTHFAGGRVVGTYKDTLGAFKQFTEQAFSALIPTTQIKFYPFEWLSIRNSFGYRLVFNTDLAIKKTFRTAFYGFGISINPIGLYRTMKK